MRLKNIIASPHPSGNRIDLTWVHPDPVTYPNVRVVRRKGTHPASFQPVTQNEGFEVKNVHLTSPEDVILVADKRSFLFYIEMKFQNDLDQSRLTIALRQRFLTEKVSLSEAAEVRVEEARNRWQIIDSMQRFLVRKEKAVLAVYGGLCRAKDENLDGETIYYYSLFPYKEGPLEYQIDSHNRTSAMATCAYNMAGQMYDLLPKIYLRYETMLPGPHDDVSEEDRQRGQLRDFLVLPGSQLDQIYSYAKAALNLYNIDEVEGCLLPLLAQWLGWETDYNLEVDKQRNEIRYAPTLYETIGIIPTVEAFVKRITNWVSFTKEYVHNIFVTNCPERLNLWVHQRDSDDNWSGSPDLLSLDFAYEGRPSAVLDDQHTLWLFYHTFKKDRWNLWFKKRQKDQDWSPSQPFVKREINDKHPTAALYGGNIWLFWVAYDVESRVWRLNYSYRTDSGWTDIENLSDVSSDCRSPWAVADNSDGLWLFWSSRREGNWNIWYNKFDGTSWGTEKQLTSGLASDGEPTAVCFDAADPDRKIWVFWSRKGPEGWNIICRTKPNTDLNDLTWNPEEELLSIPSGQKYDNREPAVSLDSQGNILVFWSSNRTGSWNIWYKIFSKELDDWTAEAPATSGHFTKKAPTSLEDGKGNVLLLFRSNESIAYSSKDYPSTTTLDGRYSGSTTIDDRNRGRIGGHGKLEDVLHYVYDTGKKNEDWYARDTIGIYLTPYTEDQQMITRSQELVKGVIDRFLPIQLRIVFIINPAVYPELIYTNDFPAEESQRLIHEQFFDSVLPEIYPGLSDSCDKDKVVEWVWLRSWSEEYPGHHSVDFTASPIETKFRTWHIGLEAGG